MVVVVTVRVTVVVTVFVGLISKRQCKSFAWGEDVKAIIILMMVYKSSKWLLYRRCTLPYKIYECMHIMEVAYNKLNTTLYLVYMLVLSQDEAPSINLTEISSFLLINYTLHLFLTDFKPQFSSRQYRSLLTPDIYTHNNMD